MNLIDWWINLNPLNYKEELALLSTRNDEYTGNETDLPSNEEFFNRLPMCNLSKPYSVRVDKCATTLIQGLFDTYIDDDTLVIYTENEHYKIKEILNTFKNRLVLSYDDILKLNMSKIASSLSKFKKVFVYIIGTQLSSGEITPQYFFIKLKFDFFDVVWPGTLFDILQHYLTFSITLNPAQSYLCSLTTRALCEALSPTAPTEQSP